MQKEADLDQLPPQDQLILSTEDIPAIAELIAEAPSYSRSLHCMHYLKFTNQGKWQAVRGELRNMLVVSPEAMYASHHFLNMDRLQLIRDVFREEQSIEGGYFNS